MTSSVLISGAGIAGPTLAFWLSKAGITTTIIERAPCLPIAGQQVDVEGAAREVVRRMGLEEIVKSKTTNEQGISFIDSSGKSRAKFGLDPTASNGRTFTSEFEILRGDLAQIFYDATRDSTEYIFGDHITQLNQNGDGVDVGFAHGSDRRFDLVVAADGMRSSTRSLVFGQKDVLRHLGMYTCYFTIPAKDGDGAWAKWYNAPGRRCIMTRPDQAGSLRTYLSVMSDKPANYHSLGIDGQKKLMREIFSDAGWESARILDGMDAASDFYMQEIAQVKMESWSKGRVALVGDAGYCPSPISGVGTSLAIVGAYFLAGEIVKHRDDAKRAFQGYEEKMRERVEKAQNLPPGAPAIANPQTGWGITIMLSVLSLVSRTGIGAWLTSGGTPKNDELPTYDFGDM